MGKELLQVVEAYMVNQRVTRIHLTLELFYIYKEMNHFVMIPEVLRIPPSSSNTLE